jgi:Mn2+/Fe2+ NRAMP family transporter
MAGFGFSFMYLNWKSPDKETRLSNWVGWSLAFSSIALLVLSEGAEFGISYGLVGLAIIPLGIAFINVDIRKSHIQIRERRSFNFYSIKNSALKNLAKFIIVIPVSLVFSLLALLLISGSTNYSEVNQLALVVLGFPFTWALVAYVYLYSQRKKMVGSALTLGTFILSGITFT